MMKYLTIPDVINNGLKDIVHRFQDFYILCFRGVISIFKPPWNVDDVLDQMEYMGANAVFIVAAFAVFIGMALSLQSEYAFMNLGGLQTYAYASIGVSVINEIGPVLTGIVFAGRSGAGMASELGSMALGHQVDTLRAFGVDPVKKLVSPRVLASLVMLPCLTIIGDAVALLGGAYVTTELNHGSSNVYWSMIRTTFQSQYIVPGLAKPLVFGVIAASSGCYMGLNAKGGARGLRNATTAAFLLAALGIIVADFLITKLSS